MEKISTILLAQPLFFNVFHGLNFLVDTIVEFNHFFFMLSVSNSTSVQLLPTLPPAAFTPLVHNPPISNPPQRRKLPCLSMEVATPFIASVTSFIEERHLVNRDYSSVLSVTPTTPPPGHFRGGEMRRDGERRSWRKEICIDSIREKNVKFYKIGINEKLNKNNTKERREKTTMRRQGR